MAEDKISQEECVEQLQSEGFSEIGVVPLDSNFVSEEHVHDEHTVHVILGGELIITDASGTLVYKEGDRVEFPRGTKHSARTGDEPGSMVVGIKKQS